MQAQDSSTLQQHALHLAAKSGNLEQINQFASTNTNFNQKISTGQTALHYAVLGNNKPIPIIDFLIKNKADPNICNDSGYTPLHYAIVNEDFTTVRFLIENGANPLIETGKISPIALMVNIAQNRSHERDPLKLDTLQTLLCVCSIAAMIQSCYGNDTDLLASLLQYASSSLLSFMTVDQLIKFYKGPKDLYLFLTSFAPLILPLFDKTMILGEASLLVRTYFAGQSILQGIQAGWRNRNLDPSKAFKTILLHSTNAAFSISNIHQKIKNIWDHHTLKLDVKSHLANNNCSEALKSASKMDYYPLRDETLGSIVDQCVKDDFSVAERAVPLMYSSSNRDLGLRKITKHQLSLGECENALKTASEIYSTGNREATLKDIALKPKCLKEHLDTAKEAAIKIQTESIKREVVQEIIYTHLDNGQCENAQKFALKVKKDFWSETNDFFLGKIALACLKKDSSIAEEAAIKIQTGSIKRDVVQEIIDTYLDNEQFKEAQKFAFKIWNDFSYETNDLLLEKIAMASLKKDPDTAKEAASRISSPNRKNLILNSIAKNPA